MFPPVGSSVGRSGASAIWPRSCCQNRSRTTTPSILTAVCACARPVSSSPRSQQPTPHVRFEGGNSILVGAGGRVVFETGESPTMQNTLSWPGPNNAYRITLVNRVRDTVRPESEIRPSLR